MFELLPVANAVIAGAPVVPKLGIGPKTPAKVLPVGGQSWLVPEDVSGVQAMPARSPLSQVPLPQDPTLPPVQRGHAPQYIRLSTRNVALMLPVPHVNEPTV